jgi:dephospho-CoA kinase
VQEAKIIALVGMSGSGKGTCTTHISEKYNVPLVHFGNMVYEEVQRRGLDNVKDEKFVREDMRAQGGPAVLAQHVAKKAQEALADGAKGVVLDGLYSWSEYKHLREVFGDDLVMIAVTAPRAERYRRVVERKDGHRKYTEASQIEERDIAEIENLEKGGPIAFADYTIANDGPPEALLSDLDKVLNRVHFAS